MNLGEVADYVRLDEKTVRSMAERGEIPAVESRQPMGI